MFRHAKWLASALTDNKQDVRFHINHIYINKNHRAMATNGYVLHVVDQLLIEPGYYKVVKNLKSVIEIVKEDAASIPDFAYPDINNLIVMTGVGDVFLDCRKDRDIQNHANLIRLMKAHAINYNLFKAAASNFSENYVVRFKEDCEHPFYLYNVQDGIMAIVMPIIQR
jgi:hypothetical protein